MLVNYVSVVAQRMLMLFFFSSLKHVVFYDTFRSNQISLFQATEMLTPACFCRSDG